MQNCPSRDEPELKCLNPKSLEAFGLKMAQEQVIGIRLLKDPIF